MKKLSHYKPLMDGSIPPLSIKNCSRDSLMVEQRKTLFPAPYLLFLIIFKRVEDYKLSEIEGYGFESHCVMYVSIAQLVERLCINLIITNISVFYPFS